MFAILAALVFAIGLVLRLSGGSLGRMDALAWLLLGAVFMALHAAFDWPLRRP